MHRIRSWAHASRYSPWSADLPTTTTPGNDVSASIRGSREAVPLDIPPAPASLKGEERVVKRFVRTLSKIVFSSWVNVLLAFVPVGIACNFADVNPTVVFVMNALAIVPLAGLLSFATESVAHCLGDTLGALLNVSFGNAVELIILIALVKNEIRIVQASLIGSILANLLLILGMCFLIGGLEYREQVYNSNVTQMSACLLCLAVLSLLLPTAFHASFSSAERADISVIKVSRGTSVVLLLVYVLYLLFQLKSHAYMYQSTPQHVIDEESHPGILRRMNSGTTSSNSSIVSSNSTQSIRSTSRVARKVRARLGRKRHVNIEEAGETSGVPSKTRGSGKNKGKDRNVPSSAPRQAVPGSFGNPTPTAPAATARLQVPRSRSFRPPVFRTPASRECPGFTRSPSDRSASYILRHHRSFPTDIYTQQSPGRPVCPHTSIVPEARPTTPPRPPPSNESEMSRTAAVVLLLCSTSLVALCAEFLVSSIGHLVHNTPLNEAFIGLIILPIIGNAAEHVTAVTVAARNKMDLAIGVAVGSSIQIALFITPIVVIIGWALDKPMSLYFNLFETVTLFASAFIVNFLVLDGRSNYLEGALLCAAYVIISVGAFFFPSEGDQSSYTAGPGKVKRDFVAGLLGAQV